MMKHANRVQQLDSPTRKGYDAIFNASYLDDIPEQVRSWGIKRVLLVVSKSLAANTHKIKDLEDHLGGLVVDKKEGVGSHSPYPDVIDIAARIHKNSVDCVISIGSSSYSDACKIACLLDATLPPGFGPDDMEGLIDQERGIVNYESDGPMKPPKVKLIVVPTSLSASEWNSVSSCTNSKGKKQHFGLWDRGQPNLIVLDPDVAATAPEILWLSSGMRAIDHCVETMCNPMLQEPQYKEVSVHAEKGLRTMITGLREYKEGRNKGNNEELLDGISNCQYAAREAMMGLVLHRVSMGPSHAIGHQLGSVAGVMHGITTCVMLSPVLRYTKKKTVVPQEKVLEIFNDVLGWHETEAADAVNKFVKYLELPSTLPEVGVTDDEQVRSIAEKTMTDAWGGKKRQMEYDEIMDVLNLVRK